MTRIAVLLIVLITPIPAVSEPASDILVEWVVDKPLRSDKFYIIFNADRKFNMTYSTGQQFTLDPDPYIPQWFDLPSPRSSRGNMTVTISSGDWTEDYFLEWVTPERSKLQTLKYELEEGSYWIGRELLTFNVYEDGTFRARNLFENKTEEQPGRFGMNFDISGTLPTNFINNSLDGEVYRLQSFKSFHYGISTDGFYSREKIQLGFENYTLYLRNTLQQSDINEKWITVGYENISRLRDRIVALISSTLIVGEENSQSTTIPLVLLPYPSIFFLPLMILVVLRRRVR